MQFEWCKWISLSLSSSSLSLYPPKYSSQMEDTFLEARPLWYLTVSLIKVEMDNADKTASSCLCLASASEDQGIPRGEGSVCCWLLRIPLKSGWEWGPTFTSPNPETNTTFQEDNARAETSPPFPLHPKESCCRAVNIFITYLKTVHLMSSLRFLTASPFHRPETSMYGMWEVHVHTPLTYHFNPFWMELRLLLAHWIHKSY